MKTTATFNRIFFLLILFSTSAISYSQTCAPTSTAAGSLDSCFGTGGKVTTQISAGLDWARGVAVQADGKIIVVGSADQTGASDFGVVRYNTNGSLDTTFDGDGKVTTDFSGRVDIGMSVKLQIDGKIVVAGVSNEYFAVARYNTDGSLDNSFDGDGRVLTDVGSPIDRIFNSAALQADGKIVVAGGGNIFGFPSFFLNVVRYNTDGSLDVSFDGDGRAIVSGITYGKGIAIQPDGKILATGSANSKFGVARLNTDGSPDTAFGTNGIAVFTNDDRYDEAVTIAVQPNDKILAAGASRPSQYGRGCGLIVRFDAGGVVESSFFNCNSGISGLYIQPDDKILTAGFDDQNLPTGFQLIRYNDVGLFDSTFNGSGILQVGFPDADLTTAYDITMQRDNKIVAVGLFQEDIFASTGKFAVVRVMSGLAAPRFAPFDFDGDGKSDVSVFRPSTNVWYGFQSSNAQVTAQEFGLPGDIITPADYDGDGKTDLGIFRSSSGDWWFKSSSSGMFNTVHWGQAGDIPRPSDFDGDGKADFVVYRPSNSVWYRFGSTGATSITAFGIAEDKPLTGDFDGDGKSDVAIFRPSTGDWWYAASSAGGGFRAIHWGASGDTPVPADFDGDGKTDFAVYRGGVWYLLNSSNGQATIVNFGLPEDKPVAADYDGDGKTDIAVFRPSTGIWYLLQSTAGFAAMQFGVSTDVAVPNAFIY